MRVHFLFLIPFACEMDSKNCKFRRSVFSVIRQIIAKMNRGFHCVVGVWNKTQLKTYFIWKTNIEGNFMLNYPNTVRFADMSNDLVYSFGFKRVITPGSIHRLIMLCHLTFLLAFIIGIMYECEATLKSKDLLSSVERPSSTQFLYSTNNNCYQRRKKRNLKAPWTVTLAPLWHSSKPTNLNVSRKNLVDILGRFKYWHWLFSSIR